MKQVERQSKVGVDLHTLQMQRREIDETLRQTEEFNLRILDPVAWNAKVRERQKKVLHEMQKFRNTTRAKMIV